MKRKDILSCGRQGWCYWTITLLKLFLPCKKDKHLAEVERLKVKTKERPKTQDNQQLLVYPLLLIAWISAS